MKAQMKLVSAFVIAFGIHSAAFAAPAASNAQARADANAINGACSNDAKTAGCSGEVVGKGLLKCMAAYKKANPSFQFSQGCHNAIERLRDDRKAPR